METELRSGFVSSSGSTTSGEEVEPVDREMEAAEALADMAHLDLREIGAGGCKWGSKGIRGKKRVKSESPSSESVWNSFTDSVPVCPDFPLQDRTIGNQQHEDPICGNIVKDPPKTEPDPNMCKPALGCGRSYSSLGGGRSKQNLSEAEKEERRLRRILANRESARQTIRRRQVLCDELAKKAADLRTENVKLKRDKDLAMKEFQSLETTNKQLKAKVAKVMKIETESSTGDSKLSRVQHATATNYPLFLYNHHIFSSLCWPHIIPSSNHVQSCHGSQDAITMPSNIPVLTNGKLDSCQQRPESATDANGIRAPLYMLPCPLFFPVPDNGNGLHHQPCFGVKHPQHETSAHDPCNGGSSSNACVLGEGQCSSFPVGVKSEAMSSMELRVIDDLNETPAGFPVNGDGQRGDPQPKEMAFASVKSESRPQPEYRSSANGACSKASHLVNPFTKKNEDPFKFPSKKPVDAAAAAEARRRRKELTKLKNLHGRQCRMNC